MTSKSTVDLKHKKDKISIKKSTNKLEVKLKGRKIRKDTNVLKKENIIKRKITKKYIIYMILLIIDILLVIYTAKQNCVNYVSIMGEDIFVSKSHYLLVGRNYINLITIVFFYIYTLVMKKFLFKEKITKKYLFGLLFFIVGLNMLLFFIFTKRIY